MEEILENKPGKKVILLGNEAIVRGALESGVQYVSTYPGTPASEIGNVFSQIAKTVGVYFEFSTNEKVALESAIGANFSGLKTLVAMKNFGLNVALESLFPLCYTGTKAGMVIIVADDPNCWSSAQSEENSRGFAKVLHIPILEPSDPQECKDFVKLGFEISEKFKIPVIVRTTTRVAHQSAIVKMSEVNIPLFQFQGKFVKDVKRFVTMPPRVLEMKKELLEKIEKIKKYSEKSKINQLLSSPEAEQARYQAGKLQVLKTGIITSGISYLHTIEGLKELNIRVPVLKLGFFYPLPEEKIKKFIKGLKKILIIEELEPYLEEEINRLAKDTNPKLQVFGKDLLSEIGELRPEFVTAAIAKIIGQSYKLSSARYSLQTKHLPRFCPGCPYWSVFATIKKVAPEGTIFGGDIGCYMLAGQPPHLMQDYLSCMGSSIGIAHGISKALRYNSGQVTEQKVITFIGDSTFFHAGIPALINTIFNKSNPLIIILDNQTTAMTGHQPHPGVGKTGMGEETTSVKIEDIVQACGVKNLKIVDPINVQEFEKAVKEFLEKEEASVIIARHMCALLAKKKET
jgi:indolepyruvate ferredoxin oxidoreductase alpha subunit